MRLADLRTKVVIKAKAKTPDGIGGNTIEWSTRGEAWARLQPLSTTEVLRLQSVRVTATHKFTFRKEVAIDQADRLEVGSRVFTIVGKPQVDIEGKSTWQTLTAVEGQPS